MSNIAPGTYITEVDQTTNTPSVNSSVCGSVGHFRWGPVGQQTLVQSIPDLQGTFGKPTLTVYQDFFSAYSFLSYSSQLVLVRVVDATARNATTAAKASLVKSKLEFDNLYTNVAGEDFIAKYPGELGNSIRVVVLDNATFAGAPASVKAKLVSTPDTSDFAYNIGYGLSTGDDAARKAVAESMMDEVHVAIIDAKGLFSGTVGSILELFPFLSKAIDGLDSDGNSVYYKKYINSNSKYVYATGTLSTQDVSRSISGKTPVPFVPFTKIYDETLALGVDGAVPGPDDYVEGWDLFKDDDQLIEAGLHYIGEAGGEKATVYQHVIDNVAPVNPKTVTCISVRKDDVNGKSQSDGLANIKTFVSTLARSTSYGVVDSGWKTMFDPYNDRTITMPCDADVAGLMAYTDSVAGPYYSPAGKTRGYLRNITGLLWTPKAPIRGELDAIRVNPIISDSAGFLLFGDRTAFAKDSVFSYINVRRLFNYLKAKCSNPLVQVLFEFNDDFTRRQFVNSINPDLSSIKSNRGIIDYQIVCDATNNPPEVVDDGEFIADVFIKAGRSIQVARLRLTAVNSGVSFTESSV